MAVSKLTLRQLLDACSCNLCVPPYQRRYVWGQTRADGSNAAADLMQCLLDAYKREKPYLLQTITLAGHDIVDGQQRLTFIALLLRKLAQDRLLELTYACRSTVQQWFENPKCAEKCETQDIANFKATNDIICDNITSIDARQFLDYLLDNVLFVCITLENPDNAIAAFEMLNGTKSPMKAGDLIKADLLKKISQSVKADAEDWWADDLRAEVCADWESWTGWWNSASVQAYYQKMLQPGSGALDMLLRLCLREEDDDFSEPLRYAEFVNYGNFDAESVKTFFGRCRRAQKRFEDAFADSEIYNRIQAVLLLQDEESCYAFLYDYFVNARVSRADLVNIYKLSFLGMTYDEILRGDTTMARFEELVAALSMADVYHTEAKRDAYRLLLRLNIDEDIKLCRKFDFSIWNNRSLEHIYSKSKVWHLDDQGRAVDGNDNPIRMPHHKIQQDPTFMNRLEIVNRDGVQLTEHCIGNLVLLYGQNNATFGNAGFEEKKVMFLAPGETSIFQSRNLLHSVCVFAGNEWTSQSIVDNYNQTLKNLKIYYGYK